MWNGINRCLAVGVVGLAALAGAPASAQTTATRNPDKDNTLYELSSGVISNGQGVDLFAGRTNQGADSIRRALLHFDLSTIPAGSTITAATLTMRLNRAAAGGSAAVALHRALAPWGEGASRDTSTTGQGTLAETGDATWLHTFYDNQFWTTPGGDFVTTSSASTTVTSSTGATFSWSGAGMVADVQSWVNAPANNLGWVVRGDETRGQTAKRFDSRHVTTVGNRPLLSITYTPPAAPFGACCANSGSCSIATLAACGVQAGAYQGDSTVCSPNPCPPPRACCDSAGVCTVVPAPICTAGGGVSQGAVSVCAPNPCPPPSGACCSSGSCVVATLAACSAGNGAYMGNSVACSGALCGSGAVTLSPTRDNTLYQTATGNLSNGSGQVVFAGPNASGSIRRGLIGFDVSGIPSNATVVDVRLRLNVGYVPAGASGGSRTLTLARVLADWGEGSSDATGDESGGATPTLADATWIHRLYNTKLWATPGGDFVGTASASGSVVAASGATLEYSGAGLVSDVQGWMASPISNSGWVILGDEASTNSLLGFDSRSGTVPPQLVVSYTLPILTGACCTLSTGACSVTAQGACAAAGGAYQADGTVCSPNPCPVPTGACCLPSGNCSTLTQSACTSASGTYNGYATVCSSVTCPIQLTPFVDALPIPSIATPTTGVPGGAAHYDIHMVEVSRKLHRDLPSTVVWGYDGQYPGPTIEARRDQPVSVSWINDLRDITTGQLRAAHYLAVDTCLHGPDITGLVPRTVVHLHGLRVGADSDGDPDATFGPGAQSALYQYPNIQQAATLWYHDHALGLTRLNVYMGLAGFYLIRDAAEDALGLPGGEYEIPLAIQDRSFNPDGSLKYPSTWQDHFAGDFVLVNGKIWPYLSVKRGKYRFRVLNGSGTRVYTLALSNGATFQQIGSDQGLLAAPVPLTQLQIAPGERADIVIDFAPYAAGTEIVLTNSAVAPFPGGPSSSIVPNVMKFVVGAQTGSTGPLPAALASVPRTPESESVMERPFELIPVQDTTCPAHAGMWLINGLMWDDITETPRVGTTEIWSWINRSPDIHAMHVHLVQFQVLDRQNFTMVDGVVTPSGPRIPPPPNEQGWKDTVQTMPGQITRVIQRFTDFAGIFPYHCHILEHEDHEMMRQFNLLCTAPSVVTPPVGGTRCQSANVMLNVVASGDALKYQWRRSGVPIANGTLSSGTTFSGAVSASLAITNGGAADTGQYDCVITNPCGQTTTTAVFVRFCIADYDCSGTLALWDIFDFITGFFNLSPRADINRSGVTDVQDIFEFLSAWFAGC